MLSLLLCTSLLVVLAGGANYCTDNWQYIIRSVAPGGLVLDAAQPQLIQIQYFANSKSQFWNFELGSQPGLFYIRSVSLNTQYLTAGSDLRTFLSAKSDSLSQQWFVNSNGRIQNAQTLDNLDIANAKYKPGTPVNVHANNNHQAQQFLLQRMTAKK